MQNFRIDYTRKLVYRDHMIVSAHNPADARKKFEERISDQPEDWNDAETQRLDVDSIEVSP